MGNIITPEQYAHTKLLSYAKTMNPKYIVGKMHGMLGEYLEAVEAGHIRRLLVFAPPQNGKPVWEEEPVLMKDGSHKKLKDICIGDYVITHKGRPRKVLKIYKQGFLPTIQLNTRLGKTPCTAKDHSFLTPEGWTEAGKLEIKDTLAILQKSKTTLGVQSKSIIKKGAIFRKPHISWGLVINNISDLIQFKKNIRIKRIKAKTFTKWALHKYKFPSEYLPDKIISIKDTGKRKCRCLLIEEDHTFTIQNIIVHNSHLTSEFFPSWCIGRNPQWSIIAATYAQERANDVGAPVRDQVDSDLHRSIFVDCCISPNSKSAKHFTTIQGGHYYSVGMKASITGRGANLLLIDDPIKGREEVESRTIRRKVIEWFKSDAYTRLRPDNRIVIILTRWHCFKGTTQILTTTGYKTAESITEDDIFITDKGIERPIKIGTSKYKDDMYTISMYGHPKSLKLTKEHKVLTTNGWKQTQHLTKNDWLIVPPLAKDLISLKNITGIKIQKGNLTLRVKKIEKEFYDGIVYDFETKSNHITAAGVIVHNCNDLAGYVLSEQKQENWVVLDFKAIAEKGDVLGREIGEPLFPEWYPLDVLNDKKAVVGSYNWNSLYQQRPTPKEGGMVKYIWLRRYSDNPDPESRGVIKTPENFIKIIISWDTAGKTEELHDPTVATIWGITKNNYFLLDVLNKKMEFPQLKRAVKNLHNIYGPSAHLIEDRGSGQSLIQDLKQNTTIPVISISTQGLDKIIRLDAVTPLFEAGRVFLPENTHWLDEYEHQLLNFPSIEHDDMVDSTSQFLKWTSKKKYKRKSTSRLYWK